MDNKKFNQLLSKHQPRVYSLALYILRDKQEAEDITQDVFTKLWHKLTQVEIETAQQWLSTVTRNACIDKLRVRKDHVEMDDEQLICNKQQEPLQSLELSQLSHKLQKAISSLKDPYSSLIALCDVKQHSQQSAAELLNLTTNQVKVYLHRARRELRTLLQENTHEWS
jgi:RNA polymerase sigma-70 factor (ECF subfamily)